MTSDLRAPVSATLSGTISDSQVAVGNGNMQVSTGGGDCIVNQTIHRPPRPREAISVLPRAQTTLEGRDAELALAFAAVAEREPVQFHGLRGTGKTALLRHLAHASTGACPEGIVYFRAAGTSLDDLLQTLFDVLFECDVPTKRTPGQLASDLAGWEVLFVLDDVGLDEDDLETLLDTVPLSAFVLSSAERTLWSVGDGVELQGLSQDAALALFEARLRRSLSEDECATFAERWQALGGIPQELVKDAERLRATARGAVLPRGAEPVPELAAPDRDLLELAGSLDGVPLGTRALADLTGRTDAAQRLAALEERGLAQSHSPRYSATSPGAPLLCGSDAAQLRSRLMAYFTERAEQGALDSARPRDDLDPIVALLRWGQAQAPHADVVRLARASDTIAARARMWDAWRTILEIGLDSARAIGDRDGEAWALHQLGTRALCLEDSGDATRHLSEALRLRRLAGDRAGAANTQHNMRFLPGGPGAPGNSDGGPLPPRSGGGSGGGGLGLSLRAPASWPLLWHVVPVLLVVASLALLTPFIDALAGDQEVRFGGGPDVIVGDRPVLDVECADAEDCPPDDGCALVDCDDPAPDPGRVDEPTDPDNHALHDERRELAWAAYAAGGDPLPPRFQTRWVDVRRAARWPRNDDEPDIDEGDPGPVDPTPIDPRRSTPRPTIPRPTIPRPTTPRWTTRAPQAPATPVPPVRRPARSARRAATASPRCWPSSSGSWGTRPSLTT